MPWLVIMDEKNPVEATQIDVLPGEEKDGVASYPGHTLGPKCECRPTLLTQNFRLLVIHKHRL